MHQNGADDEVGTGHHLFDVRGVRVQRLDGTAEHVLEIPHRIRADIEHGHLRAHADGDRRGVAANDAAAEDDDPAAPRPGHHPEEHALATALLLEAGRANLNSHPPGDFASSAKKGQASVLELDRLVGHEATPLRASSS